MLMLLAGWSHEPVAAAKAAGPSTDATRCVRQRLFDRGTGGRRPQCLQVRRGRHGRAIVMKIVAISDTHADHVTAGVSRYDEVRRVLMAAVNRAVEVHADLFVHCGDLCDPDAGPIVFECIADAIRVARLLERVGIRSIWIAGNHCIAETGRGTTVLDPVKALDAGGLVRVATAPLWIELKSVALLCLPYPSASNGYDPAAFAVSMEPLAVRAKKDGLKIVVSAHLVVPGLLPGEESGEMARGRDVMLPDVALLRLQPDLVLCGHHHRGQKFVTKAGLEVQIVGAAARFTFGEEDHTPGFLEIDV